MIRPPPIPTLFPYPTLSRSPLPVTAQGPPLDGIRVVDLTSYIAGSYAAMQLADMGAEVVKVESPEGDSFRELPGFFGWNRGDRKSTRLNSSHLVISYAVFCL